MSVSYTHLDVYKRQPEKDDSDAAGKNSQGHAYTKYDSNIKDDIVFHKAHK